MANGDKVDKDAKWYVQIAQVILSREGVLGMLVVIVVVAGIYGIWLAADHMFKQNQKLVDTATNSSEVLTNAIATGAENQKTQQLAMESLATSQETIAKSLEEFQLSVQSLDMTTQKMSMTVEKDYQLTEKSLEFQKQVINRHDANAIHETNQAEQHTTILNDLEVIKEAVVEP